MDLDRALPVLAMVVGALLAVQALFVIAWWIAKAARAALGRARVGRASRRAPGRAQPTL